MAPSASSQSIRSSAAEAQLLQPLGLGACERLEREVGQRGPAPEGQRSPPRSSWSSASAWRPASAALAGLGNPGFEAVDVERAGVMRSS